MRKSQENTPKASGKAKQPESLQEKIKRIVREELSLMLREEENQVFSKFSNKDRDALKQWILRQWFSDAKKRSPWYSPKVDESNVLEYVSTNKSFPVTPVQIAQMYRDKKSLATSLPAAAKDIEQGQEDDREAVKRASSENETKLQDIAKELGVSHQATAYFEQDGFNKFRQLYGGDPNSLEPEQLEALNSKIEAAREKAAKAFASALKASGGDMGKLLNTLHGAGFIPRGHAMTKGEREALQYIAKQYRPEQIEQLLLADIEEDDNIFKTYQMAVARTVFPDKRRKQTGD